MSKKKSIARQVGIQFAKVQSGTSAMSAWRTTMVIAVGEPLRDVVRQAVAEADLEITSVKAVHVPQWLFAALSLIQDRAEPLCVGIPVHPDFNAQDAVRLEFVNGGHSASYIPRMLPADEDLR